MEWGFMHFRPLIMFFFAVGILAGISCRADMTIVQEIEDLQNNTPEAKEQITLYVSGPRLRIDKGQSMSSIILNDKKVTYSIMHETRQYIVLPHDRFKGLGADPGAAADTADNFTVEATDKREIISGQPCQLVRIKPPDGDTTEIWMAREMLDPDSFLGEFKSLMEIGMASAPKTFDKHPELKGVPMRVTEYQGITPIHRSTIKSLKRDKLADSVFEIPAGYEEIKMPDPREQPKETPPDSP